MLFRSLYYNLQSNSIYEGENATFRGKSRISEGKIMGSNIKSAGFLKECMSDALLKLMSEKNFSQITINQISQTAGVNRSTWFRNFTSKEEAVTYKYIRLWEHAYSVFFTNFIHSSLILFHSFTFCRILPTSEGLSTLP